MAAILKNKVDDDALLIGKILYTKNVVKIRCRLEEEGAHTHRRTHTQTHTRDDRKSPPLTHNGPITSLKAVWE